MNSKYFYNNTKETNQTLFHDFLSEPNNPEELFSFLYPIYKSEKYEIYKAIYNPTREIFCVKKFSPENFLTEKKSSKYYYNKLKEETTINKCLTNKENIIQYYGSFYSFETKKIYLIYEYLEGGSVLDLGKILDRNFTEEEIALIINDILHGLIYIHQLNIVNNNIKISNILLTRNGRAKIGNFGKAIQKLNNMNEIELINSSNINSLFYEESKDPKYDIFFIALACIEMFIGIKNKFDKDNFIEQIKNVNKLSSSNVANLLDKELNKYGLKIMTVEFKDFIKKCLNPNSSKRPTAFELINHFFIKKNVNDNNKKNFSNLVINCIEKIENHKKLFYNINNHNYLLNNSKKESYYFSGKSNEVKNSLRINNINNSISNIDKLAEFRIDQMKKNEIIEDDKNSSKDLYSNLDNSSIINNEKKENNILENEKENNLDNLLIKETDDLDNIDIDFKLKMENIKNSQNKLLSPQFSENNLNYNYDSNVLKFSIKDEEQNLKLNNSIKKSIPSINLDLNKGITFSESKCDIIRLTQKINHKSSSKKNECSVFSLKNSFYEKNKEFLIIKKNLGNTIDLENKTSTRNESPESKLGIILDKRNSCIPFKIKKNFEESDVFIEDKFKDEYLYNYLDYISCIKKSKSEIKKQKMAVIKVNKLFKSQNNISRIKIV